MKTQNETTKQVFGKNVAALLLAFKANQVQSLCYEYAGENNESHQQDYTLQLKDGTCINLEVDDFPHEIEFVKNDLSDSKPLIAREFIDALLAQACELTQESIYVDNSGGGGTFTVDVEAGRVEFSNYYNQTVQEVSDHVMFKDGEVCPLTEQQKLGRGVVLDKAKAKVFIGLLVEENIKFFTTALPEGNVDVACWRDSDIAAFHALLQQSSTVRFWRFTESDVLNIEPALTQAQAMQVLDSIVGDGEIWNSHDVISDAITTLGLLRRRIDMDIHTTSQKKPIGATVSYQYKDDPTPRQGYFSFSAYIEIVNSDGFGIKDDEIFFYAEGGESALRAMMNPANGEDFVVIEWELEYAADLFGGEA